MTRLAIVGASGHGKVAADIALAIGRWTEIEFFDDAHPGISAIEDWPVIGTFADLLEVANNYDGIFIAIGNNLTRQSLLEQLNVKGYPVVSLQHPTAIVSPFANIGSGSIIMPGAVINAFSSIGEGCIINSNAVVEHDCKLGSAVHICPATAVAGEVSIGERAWIGIGARIKQCLTISNDVTVGAGAVVVTDLIDCGTYVGVPAKKTST